MNGKQITTQQLTTFARHLRQAERSPGTIENYLRHVRAFAAWLAGRPVTKEAAAEWKEHLLDKGYCPSTINAMLGGLNRFFDFVGWKKYQVKALRLQRQLFRDDSKELTRAEYDRLITAAHALGRERLALLMETICIAFVIWLVFFVEPIRCLISLREAPMRLFPLSCNV